MGSVVVPLDEWTWLIPDVLEVFVRGDPLADADYRTRWEVSLHPFHIRCLSPLPAGIWVRGRDLQLTFPALVGEEFRHIDTEQFRAYTDEDDRVRAIGPDTIRRARENRHAREGRQ